MSSTFDHRMSREEMEEAEETVDLCAKIALAGAALLAAPGLSMAWGRARGFWMGQVNVLGAESLLLNIGFVALLGLTALSAIVAAEALWHGRPARIKPALWMHVIALGASVVVAAGYVVVNYLWLFSSNWLPVAFVVCLGLLVALALQVGLVYNLSLGARTATRVDNAIRAAMRS